MNMFYLSGEALQMIDQTMAGLSANGVTLTEERSGELNFSGCATGYCMAWA